MNTEFRYVTGITRLAHELIDQWFPSGGKLALDCTLGNGHDTDYLSTRFINVIALDIQAECIRRYQAPANVQVYCMDHSEIQSLNASPELIVYNLGYLPGGDRTIRTEPETTLLSLKAALNIVTEGGFILIGIYWKHDGGAEGNAVLDLLRDVPQDQYGVLHHTYLNRVNEPPSLVVVERKRK